MTSRRSEAPPRPADHWGALEGRRSGRRPEEALEDAVGRSPRPRRRSGGVLGIRPTALAKGRHGGCDEEGQARAPTVGAEAARVLVGVVVRGRSGRAPAAGAHRRRATTFVGRGARRRAKMSSAAARHVLGAQQGDRARVRLLRAAAAGSRGQPHRRRRRRHEGFVTWSAGGRADRAEDGGGTAPPQGWDPNLLGGEGRASHFLRQHPPDATGFADYGRFFRARKALQGNLSPREGILGVAPRDVQSAVITQPGALGYARCAHRYTSMAMTPA